MFSPSVRPLTVRASSVEQVAEVAPAARAGRRRSRSPPSGTCPTGGCWRAPACARASSSKCVERRARRRRAAPSRSGGRSALVEPPSASTVVTALSKRARGRGCRDGLQVLPHHVDDAPAGERRHLRVARVGARGSRRRRAASGRAPRRRWSSSRRCPSSCSGRASARCRPRSPASRRSVMLPARSSAQYFQMSVPRPSVLAAPVAAQHRPGRHEDRRQVHRRSRP